MTALYNEIDPKAAAWLRALIAAGHIAPGIVDERSIEDLTPDYLRQFTQVHFFAGIGVWSYALRAAGWPDDRPVWTGSCPCQPFSAAGKGGGFDDERHLWPAFHWLIAQCLPAVVFGEQVASKDGLGWLDLVQADLEGTGYASGAVDLCAAGIGAPHIRQRLWWYAKRLANAHDAQWRPNAARRDERDRQDTGWPQGAGDAQGRGQSFRLVAVTQPGLEGQRGRHQAESGRNDAGRPIAEASGVERVADDRLSEPSGRYGAATDDDRRGGARVVEGVEPASCGASGGLADCDGDEPRAGRDGGSAEGQGLWVEPGGRSNAGGLANAAELGRDGRRSSRPSDEPGAIERPNGLRPASEGPPAAGPTNGLWGDADWLHCRDGKWRPVEPGTFPLAHGAPERVGRLRGYGNAIVAPAAQAFIEAYLDATVK